METRQMLKCLNDKKLADVRPGDEVIPGLLTIVSPNIGCSTMDDEFGCVFRHGVACPTHGDRETSPVLCISRKSNTRRNRDVVRRQAGVRDMEDNELTWVDGGACYLSDGEKSMACHHYQAKNPLCFGTHGISEWPCRGLSIVLVKKQEYAVWRLTK